MTLKNDRSKTRRLTWVLFFTALVAPSTASADLARELERMVGYVIVAAKTVEGWREDGKKEDGFSGCSHGRVIVFTDGTALTCSTYSYSYSYRPTAIIFAKQLQFQGRELVDYKMAVEGEVYDMRAR